MPEVQQLLMTIARQKETLAALERKLRTIQQTCQHDFIDERTHRICQKCHFAKSTHY